MDIATHALIGVAVAYPMIPHAPLSAVCFIFGSVAPDLDAFSRLFGKLAFLRWHQTYTHSLFAVILVSGLFGMTMQAAGLDRWAPVAFGLGMLLHIGLDVSNTYGTAIFAPFSARRVCVEWVFFIDLVTTLLTTIAIAAEIFLPSPEWTALIYLATLASYWLARMAMRIRAQNIAPAGTLSLIPSAFEFWNYFGYVIAGADARTFLLNAFNGRMTDEIRYPIYDDQYETELEKLAEFRMMRRLSPAYHVVSDRADETGLLLRCRDLRVRNFGGLFGELVVHFSPAGLVLEKTFHV